MNKDQKQLELLYEQVVEQAFSLLREEEKFVKECIKHVITMTESRLDNKSPREFGYRTTLRDYGLPGAPYMASEAVSEGMPRFEQEALRAIHNSIYMNFANKVLLLTANKQNFVSIKLKHKLANVPWDNKKEVIELLENFLKTCMQESLEEMKSISHASEYVAAYFKWRNEKLPIQKMEKSLPEIEGIF